MTAASLPTVLIVEDTEDTRELYVLVFEDAGFRVLGASGVEEGLALLRRGEGIDVVVTDYALPDGTGEVMLEQASREGLLQGTASLVCTAHHNVTTTSVAPVVYKPMLPDELVAVVRSLLAAANENAVA